MRRIPLPEDLRSVFEQAVADEQRIRAARDRERDAWKKRDREFKLALQQVDQRADNLLTLASDLLNLPPGSQWILAERVFLVPEDTKLVESVESAEPAAHVDELSELAEPA